MVVRTLAVGTGVFLCFLTVLRPPSGSGSTGSSGSSSPLGFPTFAMGSPLRGRGLFVLDRNEGVVPRLSLVHWSVPGWPSSLCLRRLCAPCPSGCVAGWSSICPWASVVLSSLRCSSLSLVGVTGCLRGPCCGLGLSWVPCPSSASLRFVPMLVARLAPCSRWRPLNGGSSLELRVIRGS